MSLQANLSQSVQEFTVTQISAKIKNLVEEGCGYVRIKGEISGLKIATSGHGYMNLKDDGAVLSAICWKHTHSKLEFKLEEGMEIIASGKITTYAGQSRYQISIEKIEPAGAGALMKMLIERKKRLEAEGLFDKDRKKKLPFLPKRIGIVTSPTGSVIRDMLHRIEDRCPVHVIVWPALVQGEGAAEGISEGIKIFNSLTGELKPDVIIVARGGGSIEDLWCFNEEIVVRAIAASDIPIISAIGHETDFTLSDFVSDVRAPTPTAAAEFAVPVLEDIKYTITQNFSRLRDIIWQILSHKDKILDLCKHTLSNPMKIIRSKEQNLDFVIFKLLDMLPNMISKKFMKLDTISAKLSYPKNLIEMRKMKLKYLEESLFVNSRKFMERKERDLRLQGQLFDSLSCANVLKRGYAIIKSDDEVITNAKSLKSNSGISITMHDGTVDAVIK